MKRSVCLVLSVLFIWTMGCSGGGNSIGSPGGKQEELPEDPCGVITIRWTAPTTLTNGDPLVDLVKFNIYMGFESGVYSDQIEVNDPDAVEYEITGLEYGREYYMVMTAVRAAGQLESAYSDQVVKLSNTCPNIMSFAQPTAHH